MHNTPLADSTRAVTESGYQRLYRIIWRWHFYAGLFCIPFIMTLAVSGTIYLFKPQIDAWIDRPYQQLQINGPRSSANEQIAAALQAFPDATFVNYQLPQSQSDAVIISLSRNSERTLVYINPYTLQTLKTIDFNNQFTHIVRTFHGELLAGNTGSVLVELAGCWAIVLILSGLYLWWPRGGNGLAGVLYPRLRQGGRQFWRDLHAVTGIWIAAFSLFLLVSGLPWALVWGGALKELRALQKPQASQDWTLSRTEERAAPAANKNMNVNLTPALLAAAHKLQLAPPVELAPIHGRPNVWLATSQNGNRMLRSDVHLNSTSAAVIKTHQFADKGLLDRIIGIGVSAHEGQLFGWPNQLLGLITTTGLMVMCISGFVLWRKRKPKRVLGAPPALPNASIGKTVAIIVLVMALLLPLLTASIIVLLLLELLALRHLPVLRGWLGLSNA